MKEVCVVRVESGVCGRDRDLPHDEGHEPGYGFAVTRQEMAESITSGVVRGWEDVNQLLLAAKKA